jgi:hypothetical protein
LLQVQMLRGERAAQAVEVLALKLRLEAASVERHCQLAEHNGQVRVCSHVQSFSRFYLCLIQYIFKRRCRRHVGGGKGVSEVFE